MLASHSPFAHRAAWTLRWPALALLVLAWSAFGISGWRNATRPDKVGYSIYLEAVDIARFDRTHPGVYAMGDRAGTPGDLLHEPLIQLEGLVMDKAFLANIRKAAPAGGGAPRLWGALLRGHQPGGEPWLLADRRAAGHRR